jgi:hypothetical protein
MEPWTTGTGDGNIAAMSGRLLLLKAVTVIDGGCG